MKIADQVVEFIIQLSQNAKLAEQFRKNPDTVLQTTNLSSDDKRILKTGDVEKIRARISKSGQDAKRLLQQCYECFPTQ